MGIKQQLQKWFFARHDDVQPSKIPEVQKLSAVEFLLKLAGLDLRICPCCKQGKMVINGGFELTFQNRRSLVRTVFGHN